MRRLAAAVALTLLAAACIGGPSDDAKPTSSGTPLRSLLSPGTPRWRALASAPLAVQEVGAAHAAGTIVVAGGLIDGGVTDRVFLYDVAKDRWSEGPKLPQPLHHAAAVAAGTTVWVIGGFDPQNRPLAAVYSLDAGAPAWRQRASLSQGRAAPAAVALGQAIYVFGGQGAGRLVAPVEMLDRPDGRWALKASIPTPRHHLAAATDGTHVYVSGGRVPSGGAGPDRNVAAFERYDPAADRWEKLLNVPTPRSGHGAAWFQDRIVVVGGEDTSDAGGPPIAKTEEYDPARNFWTGTLPSMFRPRHGIGVVVADGKLYVMLGGSRVGLAPSAESDALVVP